LVIPLLFVFAALGRRFPTAGGVAGFVGQAFPGLRMGASYLLVGTFGLGIPAIAITGAAYLAGALSAWLPGTRWAVTAIAGGLLLAVLAMAWRGARFAGVAQNLVVTLLIAGLAAVIALAAPSCGTIEFAAADPTVRGVWHGAALAFFAYTGWEMLAFTAEEFRNPERDFPLAVGISFVLVVALYAGASLSVQALVPLDHPLLHTAPFLVVAEQLAGPSLPIAVVGSAVVAIIAMNLNGAVWAASRLVYDVGRNGWAPAALTLGAVDRQSGAPR
jgi:amino acid efflux transporter